MARVLLGFMGAGKTTIARRLDEQFFDMDDVITQRIGMPIKDYFDLYGEPAFRKVEREVLVELLQSPYVISTGGGVVTSSQNRDLLKNNADNIYLKADFETLYQRLLADKEHDRPLFLKKSKTDLQALFDQRQAWYEEVATQTIDVSQLSPDQIVEVLK